MRDFRNKIVYITGGSAGIGLATAREMAKRGAHVIIFARREKNLKAAASAIESLRQNTDQKVSWESLDVTSNSEVKRVLAKAVKSFGTPDVLINCAGRAVPRYFQDISYKQFDETMKLNLYGYWNTISSLFPFMKKKGGYIVNVSSVGGFMGVFGYTDYSASKFAVVGLSEVLKSELKAYGINVSVLFPPDTDTPGLKVENKTKPEETRAISGTVSLVAPERVAEALLKGMKREKFIIIPGFGGKVIYLIKRLCPFIVDLYLNLVVKSVQKKKKKK